MSRLPAFVELARPQQWAKNSFVLTGLLFGHAWRDPQLIAAAAAATAAFCLASSGASATAAASTTCTSANTAKKRTTALS